MSQEEVLAQVKVAFAPYLQTPAESLRSRVKIAEHIASLTPRHDAKTGDLQPLSIPSHVTGLRRQYLRALHANLEAKQQYARVRGEVAQQLAPSSSSPPPPPNNPSSVLQSHVELLKLRKRLKSYQMLAHYTNEVESLAQEHGLFETQPPLDPPSFDQTEATPSEHSVLLASAQELTRNLELAILQANHQLKRDRRLLEELKAQRSTLEQPSPDAKLHALVAMRAKLTQWIEESLAKCDTEHIPLDDADTKSKETTRELIDYDRIIDEQYEKYLQARTRLLEAVQSLTAPLPSLAMNSSDVSEHHSQVPVVSERSSRKTSILPYIDSQHLLLMDQHQTLSRSEDHIRDLLSAHEHDLSQQLLRLSDESHILPSYPLLADAKKTIQDGNGIERSLRAWDFAMEAARTSTTATVQKQVQFGQQALHEAVALIDGLDDVNEKWKKIDLT